MEWLNYHHLYYFWTIMNEGSITAASKKLSLAQSTISAQLSTFEDFLGGSLFERAGRTLRPTDLGQLVFRYADQIFSLGQEMMDSVHGYPAPGPLTLKVGIVDALPKLVAQKLLAPASHLAKPVKLMCHEGKDDGLLADLALHKLDLILTDTPLRSKLSIKAYNHFLGECGISFFGVATIAAHLRADFPHSLDQAPILMPMSTSPLRGMADQWFDKIGVKPFVVGEFEDSALLKVFGQSGDGIFMVPSVIEREVESHYKVERIGRTREIKERFYAISVERIIKHPAVVEISNAANQELFSGG